MASAFIAALINDSPDLYRFLDPRVCAMCGLEDFRCHCYDTYDDMPYETPTSQEESGYCGWCQLDEMYCVCRENGFDFTRYTDDFNPFPEIEDMPKHIVHRLCGGRQRTWDYDRCCGREHEPTWKRQVREPRQWARHERRILAKVHPIGLETAVQIADVVENLRDQRTHEYIAQNVVQRCRIPSSESLTA